MKALIKVISSEDTASNHSIQWVGWVGGIFPSTSVGLTREGTVQMGGGGLLVRLQGSLKVRLQLRHVFTTGKQVKHVVDYDFSTVSY